MKLLEDCPLFNAGCGSVYANSGEHELEASIMDGRNIRCGAVSLLKHIKNPISLARLIMERTQHIYMAGEAAEQLAQRHGVTMVDQSYFHTERRYQQFLKAKESQIIARDHDISTPTPTPTPTPSPTPPTTTTGNPSVTQLALPNNSPLLFAVF